MMADERNPLNAVNLNLFLVLDALLANRSTTRAANALGVTPSAVSHSLRELRTVLDDPLFLRTKEGLVPTERATSVASRLADGLANLKSVLTHDEVFDPATSASNWSIQTADDSWLTILPSLVERVIEEAPHSALNIKPRIGDGLVELERGDADLSLQPAGDFPSWVGTQTLYSESVVCLVRQDHPKIKRRLTLKQYCAFPHIRIGPEGYGRSAVERELEKIGVDRQIAIYTSSFAMASEFVLNTDAILMMPAKPANILAKRHDLRVLKPPIDVPGFSIVVNWHKGRETAALAWIRQKLFDAVEDTCVG